MEQKDILNEILEKIKNKETITHDDIKKLIEHSDLYKDNVWVLTLLLLMIFMGNRDERDDTECTETLTDTTIPRE